MRLRMRGVAIATAYTGGSAPAAAVVDVEAEVERARGVRQPAEGNRIDAGFGNGAHVRERDAARRLEVAAAIDACHGASQLLGRHVVEQHRRHAAGEGLVELRERVHLDLDGELVGRGSRVRGSTAAVIEPATPIWLSLIRTAS